MTLDRDANRAAGIAVVRMAVAEGDWPWKPEGTLLVARDLLAALDAAEHRAEQAERERDGYRTDWEAYREAVERAQMAERERDEAVELLRQVIDRCWYPTDDGALCDECAGSIRAFLASLDDEKADT